MAADQPPEKDEEGGQEPFPPPETGSLIRWEKINSSQPTWSMVTIRCPNDNNCPIVFPPFLHENLHISPIPDQIHPSNSSPVSPYYLGNSDFESDSGSDSDTSSSFSPSVSVGSQSPLLLSPKTKPAGNVGRWFSSWAEIWRSIMNRFVRLVRSNFSRVFATLRSAMMAGILLIFLYFRWRRKLRNVRSEKRDQLLSVIREKDEKINRLLDQIARLNQVLLTLQRVPAPSNTA